MKRFLIWTLVIYAALAAAELAWSIPRKGHGGEFLSFVPGPVWRFWRSTFFGREDP